ncbi:plasma-membrane proton-efflux P-type ATPase [Methylomonas methanica]|uniref:Plasma-membrane proton-efflux P-type ATPase n=1 Tax=Methylomonas methanica (strain DSM 25384 / MC09) TaxID=857087 RepID=F9ZVG8_METMM|nr:plasma-membrane proton-efflux P-type ATPase [Methylomonas methanica]AEG01950.1 plasma-membrane proton-efflux P-type ATPase [Methylomonas methanica MC09]
MNTNGNSYPDPLDRNALTSLSHGDVLRHFQVSAQGLNSDDAAARLQWYGLNTIKAPRKHPLLKFLSFFWGPIAWMIEAAAILSAAVHNIDDLVIILVLLVFNAVVGFWQEYQADNAIEQLKKQLAVKSRVRRDGVWTEIDAQHLVPGDSVNIRLGDIVPADIFLTSGDYLSIDQSALTGESLPVDKKIDELVFSGSVAKQGEMDGVVVATGTATYFGKTAKLVGAAQPVSHFQKAVLTIGDYLIFTSLALVAVLILVGLERHLPLMELIQFALILTVASIPVAMPAVLSVTMAVGATTLAKLKAIVSRLEAIEELAGMDILCSDKTGTLTQNKLTLGEVATFNGADTDAVILSAALASETDSPDAIDTAILQGLSDSSALSAYQKNAFVPFDPVQKRSEASISHATQGPFKVSKGAPQVIQALCQADAKTCEQLEQTVDRFAAAGFRALGVARTDAAGRWRLLGLLSLYDPPREDAKQTLLEAQQHGVQVKMVTGDNIAIAKQICGELGLGQHIVLADQLAGSGSDKHLILEQADGYAQVFPEHKYQLVKQLQADGHLVGMTGDGVNDAPALKQADVGIAVTGATDAARAAADLVLTAPGLSVIITAIEEARRIFERMNAYAIYRITETIRVMLFMVTAILVYNSYPITAVMIILLALLNDIPILTIAKDNTHLPAKPVHWEMRRVLTVATVLGVVGVFETFLLLIVAKNHFHIGVDELRTIIFLKLAIAGHLTLFVARTKHCFLTSPHPAPILLLAIFGTQIVAMLIASQGWFVTPISWQSIGLIWGYCLFWMGIEDGLKLLVYRHLDHSLPGRQRFLATVGESMHLHFHRRP